MHSPVQHSLFNLLRLNEGLNEGDLEGGAVEDFELGELVDEGGIGDDDLRSVVDDRFVLG